MRECPENGSFLVIYGAAFSGWSNWPLGVNIRHQWINVQDTLAYLQTINTWTCSGTLSRRLGVA